MFTFDKQNLSNQQQAYVDDIFRRFAERCNRRFEGFEDFLFVAPTRTEKKVFSKNGRKFFFSGFRNIEEDDLGTDVICTLHGNTNGDDFRFVRHLMTDN